jgi:hypothetical protein
MFGLDAAEGDSPKVAATITTQRPGVTNGVLREALAQGTREIRRTVAPDALYGGTLEFTTGEAARSGGVRRPHLHLLWKHVDPDDGDRIRQALTGPFKRLTGAHSHVVEEIRSPGRAVRYVAAHHLKESQAPPPSWRGRRVWTSKGWWSIGADETRRRASEAFRENRLVWLCERELANELREVEGSVPADVWDELLAGRIEKRRREALRWEVVRVREVEHADPFTGEIRARAVEVVGRV